MVDSQHLGSAEVLPSKPWCRPWFEVVSELRARSRLWRKVADDRRARSTRWRELVSELDPTFLVLRRLLSLRLPSEGGLLLANGASSRPIGRDAATSRSTVRTPRLVDGAEALRFACLDRRDARQTSRRQGKRAWLLVDCHRGRLRPRSRHRAPRNYGHVGRARRSAEGCFCTPHQRTRALVRAPSLASRVLGRVCKPERPRIPGALRAHTALAPRRRSPCGSLATI